MAFNLTDYPFDQFEQMVKTTPTVILPVGIIEQHGHHLPLGVDVFNCTEPLRIGFDRINAFIAPGFHYCFSGGTLPGTMNVNPQLFGLMISDICSEFVRIGFKNVVMLLGHGGSENMAAMKESIRMLQRRDAKMKDISFVILTAGMLSETAGKYFNMEPEHDFHAGLTETSRMLYWKPELVQLDRLVEDDPEICRMMRTDQDWYETKEKNFDHPGTVEKITQREEIKIGVMGFPGKADAKIGEQICNELIDSLSKLCDDLNERAKNL